MTDNDPQATGIYDQLQAEVRTVAIRILREKDAKLTVRHLDAIELGVMVGCTAALVVLNRWGWVDPARVAVWANRGQQ